MRLEDFEVIIQWQWDTEKEKNTLRLKSNVNPLIRCKNCKHKPLEKDDPNFWKWYGEDHICPWFCADTYYITIPPDDFFCAYGENAAGVPDSSIESC